MVEHVSAGGSLDAVPFEPEPLERVVGMMEERLGGTEVGPSLEVMEWSWS